MRDHWPHAPLHRLEGQGVYMVTSGTFQKAHYFHTPERRTFLQNSLLECANEFGWQMQAWAVFSNHYHFIAIAPEDSKSLRKLIVKLHGTTASAINQLDQQQGRRVWHQYWDSCLSYQKSYMARLNYVHNNPVRHKLVKEATDYPWCSASWFRQAASTAFRRSVERFGTDFLNIEDEF